MVRHIVLWNFKDGLTEQEKKDAAERISRELLAVKEAAEGVISLEVATKGMESGNRQIALISSFESAEALNAYQVHPAHVKAAEYIRQVTCDRACFDCEYSE